MNPINSHAEHQTALKRIDEIIAEDSNPQEGTPLYDELMKLGDLVWAYEEIHYPID